MKKSNNNRFYGLKWFWNSFLEVLSHPNSKGEPIWIGGCLSPIIWIVAMILIIKLDGCFDFSTYDNRYDNPYGR